MKATHFDAATAAKGKEEAEHDKNWPYIRTKDISNSDNAKVKLEDMHSKIDI